MPRPLKHTDFTEPESPGCPHCGGRDLMRGSVANGKKRFKCRACGRWSYGEAPPAPPALPCPHCGGRCVKSGRDPKGRQRYVCLACGKKNTDLYPEAPRSPGGPFRHRVTLYLGPLALGSLIEYCSGSGMSVAQAVRDILRRPATAALGMTASYTARSHRWPAAVVAQKLPDVRRDVTGERMRRRGEEKHMPTVYVSAKVSLALDDVAKEGLLRVMRGQNLTHQEAARYLIAGARPAKRRRGTG